MWGGSLLLDFPGKEPPHKEFLGWDPNWGIFGVFLYVYVLFSFLNKLSTQHWGGNGFFVIFVVHFNFEFRPRFCTYESKNWAPFLKPTACIYIYIYARELVLVPLFWPYQESGTVPHKKKIILTAASSKSRVRNRPTG